MQPGTRLEHYEIGEPIGEGGMGAVYAAEDTRLKRTVAIKVLPPELASDPERLARLEREAQLLASLNHPNVATVHGFGHEQITEDGRTRPVTFLVMELVEGPSLHDRLATGPLPWREAVEIAIGIAAGLEAAHERGIVHRDLKPANVHVTDDGGVKVLDFGLAKAFEGDTASGSLELSASPTVAAATRTGMILGTASYMSPEQARGKAVDKRSDIWALGCVLFEMLAGKKAFRGETVSDILASILKEDPDYDALPPIPIRLRHLLERCLAKHPAQRTRDVGDVRLELETARLEEPRPATASDVRTSPVLLGAAAAVALVLGLAAGYALRGGPAPGAEMRLLVTPESVGQGVDALEISPDGRWIAETGPDGIRIRAIDDLGWRDIGATASAFSLTFSADSSRLYFTRAGGTSLFSVGLDGATPTTEAEIGPGVVSTVFRGIAGAPTVATSAAGSYVIRRLEPDRGLVEVTRGSSPGFLVIVTAQATDDRFLGWRITQGSVGGLVLLGLDEADNRALLEDYRGPLALPDGRIMAVDGSGRLVTARVDFRSGAVVTPPVIELEGFGLFAGFAPAYSLSDNGTLVYMAGVAAELSVGQTLSWVDRDGGVDTLSARRGDYQIDSRVSPDGNLLALEVVDEDSVAVWIHDITRDVQTALTPGLTTSFPVWSPDSREIVFRMAGDDAPGMYRVPVDRSGPPEMLLANSEDRHVLPVDWSPDGEMLLYVDSTSATRSATAERNDLWLLPLDGGEARPFVNTAAGEIDGRFSPDGRWIAYQSDQTGQAEVYLRAVSGGAEYRISADGGTSPEWNAAGGELFFARGRVLRVVEIDTTGTRPEVSAERSLASYPDGARPGLWHPHPDGERFLMAIGGTDDSDETPRSIVGLFNWRALQR